MFFAFKSTSGARRWNGVRSGSTAKEAYRGIAAASSWLMGDSPKSNSIERTNELVVYSVLSTTPRFTYGVT